MKKMLYVLLACVLVPLLALSGCSKSPAPDDPEPTPSVQTNWWDKWGTPQYGGTITIPTLFPLLGPLPSAYDPSNWMNFYNGSYETLFTSDWTVDRAKFSFQSAWTPDEYWVGALAKSWEWNDAQTMTIHIRENVHWHNKPPVNGREFTAEDVQFHFDRMMGTGNGFTKPNPMFMNFITALEKVSAADKYTVVVKFKNPTPVKNFWTMLDMNAQMMEAREVIQQYGEITDWRNAIGTGPFMISDVVPNVSITLTKNPDYWGYDERHPENRLPYVDTIKTLNIGDMSTALAALRSGKIDLITGINWIQAQSLARTNPELQQEGAPAGANVVYFRADKGPMADIRVRKALQMTLDRESLQNNFYQGNADTTPYGVIFPVYKDWSFAYKDWPQELKNEYSYNLTEAKRLLAEAGYPSGFKTNILSPREFDMELLQIIKANFMNVGVDMEITLEDGPVINGIIGAKKQEQMDYGTGGTTHPWIMLENIASWGQNRATHHDADFDALAKNFMNAQDLAEAKKWAVAADKYTIEQHWALRSGMVKSYNIWQPNLKGYSGEILQAPTAAPQLWFLARMWKDNDLK